MKLLTVEEAAKPVPYIGSLVSHPFAEIVKDYLGSRNIDANQIIRQAKNEVVWSFCINGVSVAYRLYKDTHHEVFLHMECAFGFVAKGCEDMLATTLIQEHYHHHYPFWHALNEDRLAVVLFRSYVGGITESHFLLRLDTIIKLGMHCREVYLSAGLGLQPLPKSWFVIKKVAS